MSVDTDLLILHREEPRITLQNAEWPKQIRVSLLLLRSADQHALSIGPKSLTFWLTNGRATYKIVAWDTDAGALICELVLAEGPSRGEE